MDLKVDLGPMPSDDHSGCMVGGLRTMLDKGELCDIILTAGGLSFPVHRAVLAAVSANFRECLMHVGSSEGASGMNSQAPVLQLDDISHPEAVQAMLACIYGPREGASGEYGASTDDANRDALRLAQRFQVAALEDQASRWLMKGLSTANVLERLKACEEFGLVEVREKILVQLTQNPEALLVLAQDPDATNVPAVLQELLVRVLKLLGCQSNIQRTSKTKNKALRKAGA